MKKVTKKLRLERRNQPEPKHTNPTNQCGIYDTSYSTVSQIHNHHIVDFYYHNSIASATVRQCKIEILAMSDELQQQLGIPSYQEQRRELML